MDVRTPASAVRCLKADGLRQVWLTHRDGESPRVLKTWPLNVWWLLRFMLGVSPPQRLARGSRILRDLGVAVPEVLSGPRLVADGRQFSVDTELAFVPGVSGWELLQNAARSGSLDSADMRRAARSIGDIVACLIRNGRFHRDLTLGNFVIDEDAGVWIVDTDSVRRMRNRVREIERMLGRLAAVPLHESMDLPAGVQRSVLMPVLRALPPHVRRALVRDLRSQVWVQSLQARRDS